MSTVSGGTPTLHQLVNMKAVNGKPLGVIRRIAVNYTFGMNLLLDENGEKVDVIERDHKEAEAIAHEILKKWQRWRAYIYLPIPDGVFE